MATVHIPALLRDLTGGTEEVQVEVPEERMSVRRLIDELERHYPGIRDRLVEDDHLVYGTAVFVDNEQSRMGLLEKVGPDSHVHFLPPIAGGR